MDFLCPASWADALAAKAEHPEATAIAGGTDVMVEINFDHRRPTILLDLTRLAEIQGWHADGDDLVLGAGASYTKIISGLAGQLPALCQAARTVGSPQIRNRGTVGGNLGAASPAGDAHPALLAGEAVIEAESARGVRRIAVDDFYTGAKRNALAEDELIRSIRLPLGRGPSYFAKIGTRNAMVIAVCSFSVGLHTGKRAVRTGIGSAGPTPLRAAAAEAFIAAELESSGRWESRAAIGEKAALKFGELAARAAEPIDDVRGTAAYRRHCLAVLARRTLNWAWADYQNDHTASTSAES